MRDMKNYKQDRLDAEQKAYYESKKIYLGGSGIVRIVLGIALVMGAVGAQDVAVAAGEVASMPMKETVLYSIIGIGMIAWGAIVAQEGQE